MQDGKAYAAIETEFPLTDFARYPNSGKLDLHLQFLLALILHWPKGYTSTQLVHFFIRKLSGLIFLSNEAPKMQQYFVPSLGPAPTWCSFLETLTEELEEADTTTG